MIARTENTDPLADIWLKASLCAHRFIPESYWRSNYTAMREVYLPAVDNYVYTDDETGEPLGFISLADNGWIEALFVMPERQGGGVGQALLDHAKGLYTKLYLSVYERNERAVAFYQKNGFIVQERRTDPNVSEPELVMVFG